MQKPKHLGTRSLVLLLALAASLATSCKASTFMTKDQLKYFDDSYRTFFETEKNDYLTSMKHGWACDPDVSLLFIGPSNEAFFAGHDVEGNDRVLVGQFYMKEVYIAQVLHEAVPSVVDFYVTDDIDDYIGMNLDQLKQLGYQYVTIWVSDGRWKVADLIESKETILDGYRNFPVKQETDRFIEALMKALNDPTEKCRRTERVSVK